MTRRAHDAGNPRTADSGSIARLVPPSSNSPSQNVTVYEQGQPRQVAERDSAARVEAIPDRVTSECKATDGIGNPVGQKRGARDLAGRQPKAEARTPEEVVAGQERVVERGQSYREQQLSNARVVDVGAEVSPRCRIQLNVEDTERDCEQRQADERRQRTTQAVDDGGLIRVAAYPQSSSRRREL